MDIVGAVNHDIEYRARYLRMLVRGAATVAVSHGFAELVTKELAPELSGKLSVIYNGVCKEMLLSHEPIETPLPARYILNVGTFETKKGQCHLINAFSQIAKHYPDLHLVLVGRTGGIISI